MTTALWINQPSILLKHDSLNEFWPQGKMSLNEKINAITRLILILTLLGYLLTFSLKILVAGLVTLIAIILLHILQNRNSIGPDSSLIKEMFSNKLPGVYPNDSNPKLYELNKDSYIEPTEENPLMNVLLPEIKYDPKRKPAAPTFNANVEKKINDSVKEFVEKPFRDKNINQKLFGSVEDEFDLDRSMLQFTATANTTIPNDQNKFLKFLYGGLQLKKRTNVYEPNSDRVTEGSISYFGKLNPKGHNQTNKKLIDIKFDGGKESANTEFSRFDCLD